MLPIHMYSMYTYISSIMLPIHKWPDCCNWWFLLCNKLTVLVLQLAAKMTSPILLPAERVIIYIHIYK